MLTKESLLAQIRPMTKTLSDDQIILQALLNYRVNLEQEEKHFNNSLRSYLADLQEAHLPGE